MDASRSRRNEEDRTEAEGSVRKRQRPKVQDVDPTEATISTLSTKALEQLKIL
jgi:hypothetical protein